MEPQYKKRSAFSGKIGFVLSAAGASVGLGNIWRFPYLAAKYGGGIFLLIYILLAFTFGYTMIVAETALGRMTKKSPVGAFAAFGKKGGLSFGGWINAIIPILIVPYYWSLAAGSSGTWRITLPGTARSWPRTAISRRSSPMVLRRRSALSSSPSSRWRSSLRASATAWNGSPKS